MDQRGGVWLAGSRTNMLNLFQLHLISGLFMSVCDTSFGKSYHVRELTVTGKDLRKCEFSDNYCVMDPSDCSLIKAAPSGLVADTIEDFKCLFSNGQTTKSLTCLWKTKNDDNARETKTSLILSSMQGFRDCQYVLFIGSNLNITLKMQDIITKKESLSGPFFQSLREIVKPSPPVDIGVVTSPHSLNVTWTKEPKIVGCKIRYKANDVDGWTEVPLEAPANTANKKKWTYMIDNLQAFTLYTLSISCVTEYKHWSDWSQAWSGMTPASAPSPPSRVCYHVEDSSSYRIFLLWVMPSERTIGSTILGYRVAVSGNHPYQSPNITSTTARKLTLEVIKAAQDISITAYNAVGESPPYRLRVSAGEPASNLTPVRSLWVYSKGDRLWVEWYVDPEVQVSEFAVECVAVADPDSVHWTWVEGSGHVLTSLTGDFEPMQTYVINVYPISGTHCGLPSSLQASPQNGALVDVVDMRVAMVTEERVSVVWRWQRKQHDTGILRYSLVLSSEGHDRAIMITPDMKSHLFHSLRPNTEYSVHVSAQTLSGNISTYKQDFNTPLADRQEVTSLRVIAIVLILILITATGVVSITCRVVYRKYIILRAADPQKSLVGQWLMSFDMTGGEQRVLKVEDLSLSQANNNNIQIEKMLLMLPYSPGDASTTHQDTTTGIMSSKNGSRQRCVEFKGSDTSLRFIKPQRGTSLHPSSAGDVHNVPSSENSGCGHQSHFDKAGDDVNETQKSPHFTTNTDYVTSFPALAEELFVDISTNISSDRLPENNIVSIPQHFESGYVRDIPTDTVLSGILPNQSTGLSNVSHSRQVDTD
ncbi:uncharacterized protein LOC134445734 isoform X2 [Engraulis encrasicolus]|uniref:uncharacterized protein LOC134445734 isoform X2 n=1 Tax=Engraulis encrasicolus TaxID=184585 RepID=UPI002FD39235